MCNNELQHKVKYELSIYVCLPKISNVNTKGICLYVFTYFCKKIIGLLKFTHNALMYVILSIENYFNHVLNDIDDVCKSILLHSSICFWLISPK